MRPTPTFQLYSFRNDKRPMMKGQYEKRAIVKLFKFLLLPQEQLDLEKLGDKSKELAKIVQMRLIPDFLLDLFRNDNKRKFEIDQKGERSENLIFDPSLFKLRLQLNEKSWKALVGLDLKQRHEPSKWSLEVKDLRIRKVAHTHKTFFF